MIKNHNLDMPLLARSGYTPAKYYIILLSAAHLRVHLSRVQDTVVERISSTWKISLTQILLKVLEYSDFRFPHLLIYGICLKRIKNALSTPKW